MGKVILSILGLVVGLMLITGPLIDVVNDVATDEYTENFSSTTGAGVTNDTKTLSYEHYYEDLTDLSATSDNVLDTPVILEYDATSYNTTVGGLAASDTRILSITYAREAHQEFTGFAGFVGLSPFIFGLGLIVACLWGLFSAWKSR